MFHKNQLLKFKVDEDVKEIAMKTLTSCEDVGKGLVKLRTNDCVIYTVSMDEANIPLLLSTYNDFIWERDTGVKSTTFPAYAVVGRLDLD